jgi:hypothetical protein
MAIPVKIDIIEAVLCLTITVSLVHERLGKLKFITNPYRDTNKEKEANDNTTNRLSIKGMCIVKHINIEAKSAGNTIVKLTNILDAKISNIDIGRLFAIQMLFPSIDIEAIVVQDIDTQKVMNMGIISCMAPEISISEDKELISIKGSAIAPSTIITTPKPEFITYIEDAKYLLRSFIYNAFKGDELLRLLGLYFALYLPVIIIEFICLNTNPTSRENTINARIEIVINISSEAMFPLVTA